MCFHDNPTSILQKIGNECFVQRVIIKHFFRLKISHVRTLTIFNVADRFTVSLTKTWANANAKRNNYYTNSKTRSREPEVFETSVGYTNN